MPAFKAFRDSAVAPIEEGDTLQSIAERASAEGNAITAQDIGLFNWGAREPEHIQELMRDELGARKRTSPVEFVLSPEDEAREALRIPEAFEQDGFATTKTHTVQIRTKTCADQFIGCSSLPSITFPFDSSFVRPSVAENLGAVEELIARDDASTLMIFGHTDAVGSAGYNKRLSERRAWSVYAFILNDADAWEVLYNHPDEEWGVAVIQEILADLGYDPGAFDGDLGPATKAQMCGFLGVPEATPVKNDAAFRAQLFAAYMGGKHNIEIDEGRFLDPGHMGCGEFNMLNDVDAADARNRRVTIYAFHKDRPPRLPCAYDDTKPCERQMVDTDQRYQTGFACSFYDSLAGHCPGEGLRCLHVYLLDVDGRAIPNCPFRVRAGDGVIVEGHADGEGLAELPDSVPFIVEIDWDRPKRADADPAAFRFTQSYVVSVSAPRTRSGCSVRLDNLGYRADTFEDSRSAFSEEFGTHFETPLDALASDIDLWHKSGDPSHIGIEEAGSSDEDDDAEEVEVDPDPNFESGGEEDYDDYDEEESA